MFKFDHSKNPIVPIPSSVTERRELSAYREPMLAYFSANARWHEIEGEGGVPLSAVSIVPEGARVCLFVLNGYADSLLYYVEFAYLLRESGIAIVLYDHRGQGLSGRMLPDDPRKGYVESYEGYVRDARRVFAVLLKPEGFERRVLLGHSMGASVATLYLASRPYDFDGLVLCAPMFRIRTHPVPRFLAGLIVSLQILAGRGAEYVPGQGEIVVPSLEENVITSDRLHYDLILQTVSEHPEIILSGATGHWAAEAFRLARAARRALRGLLHPILLLHGECDPVVRIAKRDYPWSATERFAHREIALARHGLFLERVAAQKEIVREVSSFIQTLRPTLSAVSRDVV